ncbi:male sterility protein-domain-containing protein [Daedaleopsis nitida]|nr:male sterility protein-domain-containing protein [Daedaleopsis nitida]
MEAIIDGHMHAATASASPDELVRMAARYSADIPSRPPSLRPRPKTGKDVVLITGTTGNFGSDLLENLLREDTIGKIYAVNRRGSQALERQKAAFREREFDETILDSERFIMVEGDLGAPWLGIEPTLLEEIRGSVTYMIHNAWRVNFNLPVDSFDVYLRALRTLVDLAISCPYTEPPKVQYISSITVFGQCEIPAPVPEEPMEPNSAMGSGYGESKWVGEQILLSIAESTNVSIQIVRLAQICGHRDGYWNSDEWFPAMVKSAFLTNCLPDIDGEAAFVPNDPAARALIEMRTSPEVILHLVHPRPPRLRTLFASVGEELGMPLVPYDEWVGALSRSARSMAAELSRAEYIQAIRRNPSLILLGFFCTRHFLTGNEMTHFIGLSTDKACAASVTLEHLPDLDEDITTRWLAAWRAAGFLEDQR